MHYETRWLFAAGCPIEELADSLMLSMTNVQGVGATIRFSAFKFPESENVTFSYTIRVCMPDDNESCAIVKQIRNQIFDLVRIYIVCFRCVKSLNALVARRKMTT